MCGIAGLIFRRDSVDSDLLIKMRDSMRHRGPDAAGLWMSDDARIGLAHRRLAIIDLSPLGHQPMVDPERQNVIAFNGEIYNFRALRFELEQKGHCFRSQSDTEVLLEAYREWGEDCPKHLNGMFAFAIWNAEKRLLFMARDRVGEKPLFYFHDTCGLRFASELKALLADPALSRRLDLESLEMYLTLGYVPSPRCILNGYAKLPPAHALTFSPDSGAVNIWSYWTLPESRSYSSSGQLVSNHSVDDLAAELDWLLEDSVRRQMIADVPVGILLSGGVDSSLVTAYAARVSSAPVRTFTAVFPGGGHLNETEYSRTIARHFGTIHAELPVPPVSLDVVRRLAQQFDEPMVDSSMIPTLLVSQLIRNYATVALGGDGGDEIFGGYLHYRRILQLHRYNDCIPFGSSVTTRMLDLLRDCLPAGVRGRNYIQALIAIKNGRNPQARALFDRRELPILFPGLGWNMEATRSVSEEYWDSLAPVSDSLVSRVSRSDFHGYLAEDVLVKVDRASMLTSLEVRAPFLDYRIVEFAFSRVPDELKTTRRESKILPKLLARKLFPRGYDYCRKQGFSIPLGLWIREEFGSEILNAFMTSPVAYVDKKQLQNSLEFHKRLGGNSERIFGILLLLLWLEEYRIQA